MTPKGETRCLHCPYGNPLPPGSRSFRCERCREEHRKKKNADNSWASRQRARQKRRERDKALGRTPRERQLQPREFAPRRDNRGLKTAAEPVENLMGAVEDLSDAVVEMVARLQGVSEAIEYLKARHAP